jgi:hypothetical protein
MKKLVNDNPTIFAQTTETWKVAKFAYDEEGNIINPDFNNKTYLKKAYKSYLQGKDFFRYKENIYPVPKMKRKQLEDIINNLNEKE